MLIFLNRKVCFKKIYSIFVPKKVHFKLLGHHENSFLVFSFYSSFLSSCFPLFLYYSDHHCHYHHTSVMELGHLLTRSGLTYPEASSNVYHDSFCQLASSISLPRVIYFEAFYLQAVSSFSRIPVICPKLVLFLTPLQFVHLFYNLSKCILLSFSCISSLLLLLFWRSLPYNKTGRASVLYSFILVFLRVFFCGLNTSYKIPVIFKKLFNLLSMSSSPS